MQKIDNQSIEEMLDKSNNIAKAIDGIKTLLVSDGYKDYSYKNELLFIKASGSSSHTIQVNLRKYDTHHTTQTNKENKKSLKNDKTTVEDKELFTKHKKQETPFQKSLHVLKKGAIGIVSVGVLLSIMSASLFPLIGLTGSLLLIIFPAVWLYHSIKDSNTTKRINKMAKKATTDFMSNKPKASDEKDTADTLLKYHSLLEKGAISKAEYNQIKKDLLNIK